MISSIRLFFVSFFTDVFRKTCQTVIHACKSGIRDMHDGKHACMHTTCKQTTCKVSSCGVRCLSVRPTLSYTYSACLSQWGSKWGYFLCAVALSRHSRHALHVTHFTSRASRAFTRFTRLHALHALHVTCTRFTRTRFTRLHALHVPPRVYSE